MKIELSQTEIKAAITAFVASNFGIDLAKTEVAITFSATRLNGTIANLETKPRQAVSPVAPAASQTEAAVIPGYSDNTVADAPIVTGTAEPTVDPVDAAEAAAAAGDITTEAVVEGADAVETTGTEAAPEAPDEEAAPAAETKPKSTATLFGKPASA